MTSLALAAIYFLGIHVFVSGSGLRDRIVAKTGEPVFQGLFSLLSLVGIVWLVRAYTVAPTITLWTSALWFRPIVLLLVLVAALLVVIGLTTPSPTAMGGDALLEEAEPATGILRISRHPFLMGVALWAATHLVASGDAAGTVLFGTMFVLGAIGPRLIDKKRARRLGESWRPFAQSTSVLPFAAIAGGRNRFVAGELGAWRVVAAIVVYGVLFGGHAWMFGVPLMPMG